MASIKALSLHPKEMTDMIDIGFASDDSVLWVFFTSRPFSCPPHKILAIPEKSFSHVHRANDYMDAMKKLLNGNASVII